MYSFLFLSALAAVNAVPTPAEQKRQAPFQITEQAAWNAGAIEQWQIHASCNASERYQLSQGLNETVQLAQHAKDHINRWGNSSEIYQKYFGNRPTVEAVGALDVIVNGDRSGVLFRCDDPDENCANFPDWAGHWRGNNASDETVICPLSFEIRRPLSTVCGQGYNVREYARTIFWAGDLMHRLYHIPAYGQGWVEHFAEDYEENIEAARQNSPNVTHDSNGITYFALEAFAYDVINPGAGCPGPSGDLPSSESSSAASATSTVSALTTVSAAAASTSATESALPENCHTHANGDVHCAADETASASESATATAASAEASATESAGGQDCHTHANGELHCV